MVQRLKERKRKEKGSHLFAFFAPFVEAVYQGKSRLRRETYETGCTQINTDNKIW